MILVPETFLEVVARGRSREAHVELNALGQRIGAGGGTSRSDNLTQEVGQSTICRATLRPRQAVNRRVSTGGSGAACGDMAIECSGVRALLEANRILSTSIMSSCE